MAGGKEGRAIHGERSLTLINVVQNSKLREIARQVGSLSGVRPTVLLAVLILLLVAMWVHLNRLEGRLLRADPDTVPSNATLMTFAYPRGKRLYDAHCATCHGARGRGDGARGIPDLSDGDWLYGAGSVSDIEQVIKYGIRSYNPKAWNLASMPAYATPRPSPTDPNIPPLSPGNIRDLVEFLFRAQGHEADSEAAARGAALFGGAGGCYDCHAADAKGDSAIGAPNLTDRITLYGDGGREALATSIAYGRHGVCPAWVTRIQSAGIREMALYVSTLAQHAVPSQSALETP
jgi:cytochrome c oxidase cbb3-type subunit III